MYSRIKILERSHFERERLFACLYSLLTTTDTTTRSFKRPTLKCGCFCSIFSFFSLKNETVRSKFVTLGTHTHTPKRFSLERERERGPGFWTLLLYATTNTRDSFFYSSFRVLVLGEREKERENYQMAIGDAAARTNPPNDDGAAPLPIVATENATETTDGGIDRSVHPSGIVPTLQCVLFCSSFMCILIISEMRR